MRKKSCANKPADLVDACWTQDGRKIAEPAVFGKASECNSLFPPHSAPRLEAGAPLADDIWKCQLKPIDWKDYKVTFTDAEKARLKQIFADGVCDWTKPRHWRRRGIKERGNAIRQGGGFSILSTTLDYPQTTSSPLVDCLTVDC